MKDMENSLMEVASRIRDFREILGYSASQMAEKTDTDEALYLSYEAGKVDLPFTFIHKCAQAFGVDMSDLLEGKSAKLSSYTVTRRGKGQLTAKEDGIEISNLAPMFKGKIAEPYYVRYEYSEDLQNKPIHLTTHGGQEFDIVISGSLKVQVGDHTVVLEEGDSIYYESGTPHGMIAVGGKECVFCAVVLPGEDGADERARVENIAASGRREKLLISDFIKCTEDDKGVLTDIAFENEEKYNFAFDTVDALADKDVGDDKERCAERNDKPIQWAED